MSYLNLSELRVDSELEAFVREELIIDIPNLESQHFWSALSALHSEFSPRIKQALQQRDHIQGKIDEWYENQRSSGVERSHDEYIAFLTEIGYLEPVPQSVAVATTNVDPEIGHQFAPQLVVPASNARFVLNAANARWGSLYDALYGTDAILPTQHTSTGFDLTRAAAVSAHAAQYLDQWLPLTSGSHKDATRYCVVDGNLAINLTSGVTVSLTNSDNLVGYDGPPNSPSSIFAQHNGLIIELCFDSNTVVGKKHPAGLSDIKMEAALTTIVDFEDSVADVDAADKVVTYRNWLGLMRGTLKASFEKVGKTVSRSLNPDRSILRPNGETTTLAARSVLMVRNVGHHMYTDAVLDAQGNHLPEGLVDAMVSITAAVHDLKKSDSDTDQASSAMRNSRCGSIYIVKPKMHGSDEVRLTCDIFSAVEKILSLEPNTIKIGIMDEERRTSVNLRACMAEAVDRVAFINTGFLDRTGDEIHTAMHAGAVVRKADMQTAPWLSAYEKHNVDEGIGCGLLGHGQIGKGMWARPDDMNAMLKIKSSHLAAGASTAWVPSPTAATLHALHYHQMDVRQIQTEIAKRTSTNRTELLNVPLARGKNWNAAEINSELEQNTQSILGYVVRWIDQGIGCSKVADPNNVYLMEDRATLRISSQHIANWIKHDICSKAQVYEVMKKMAKVVDMQNSDDPAYQPMSGNETESIAFKAACDLVFQGAEQANGYTERVLCARRREAKLAQT